MITFEQGKALVADLARPFAIYATAGASAFAIVDIARRIGSGEAGAIFIGVVLGGLSALYVGKAYENTRLSAHSAEVEKVRAQASPPPAEALKAAPAADVAEADAEPDPTMYGGPRL